MEKSSNHFAQADKIISNWSKWKQQLAEPDPKRKENFNVSKKL